MIEDQSKYKNSDIDTADSNETVTADMENEDNSEDAGIENLYQAIKGKKAEENIWFMRYMRISYPVFSTLEYDHF